MKAKQLILQRLPIVLAASALSTGLFLSGCSNNDSTETIPVATNENSAEAITQETETTGTNNSTEQQAITSDDNAANNVTDDATNTDSAAVSDVINPAAANDKQPSLVTNSTRAGTPEDTVKQALDTLYYGDVKQAATYYKVEMADFVDELAKTQYAFQQTVESVSIMDTKYNSDKTHATISGELMLKDQSKPTPLTYELQKVKGEWKILG